MDGMDLIKDCTTLTLCVLASDLADLLRETVQENRRDIYGEIFDIYSAVSGELERRRVKECEG